MIDRRQLLGSLLVSPVVAALARPAALPEPNTGALVLVEVDPEGAPGVFTAVVELEPIEFQAERFLEVVARAYNIPPRYLRGAG